MDPTPEQQAVIDAFTTGESVKIAAGAGSGKTTTLRLLANSAPRRRGLYMAFNKAIATDAQKSFPRSVTVKTTHALAFAKVGRRYRHRLNEPRQPYTRMADTLGIDEKLVVGEKRELTPAQQARLAQTMVTNYCGSADDELTAQHLPSMTGLDPAGRSEIGSILLPHAHTIWRDWQAVDGGRFKYQHDCQPPGTLVRRVTSGHTHGRETQWEDVPIESLQVGDKVVSYSSSQRRGYVRRSGRRVTAVGSRPYRGDLITVKSETGRSSSYTDTHKCVVRLDCDLADGNFVVYLARRGDDFRIGRTTWRTRSQHNGLGVIRRAISQAADSIWILSVHPTDRDAALEEASVAHRFGIPTWQFRSPNETMPLAEFWTRFGSNEPKARECLAAAGLRFDYPFWQGGDGWRGTRRPIVVRAINVLSGMQMLEVDEVTPIGKGNLFAHDGAGGWKSITVTRSPYEGTVYNLDVDVDHTYVADGIVTHNCYLKMFALNCGNWGYDYLLFDEAQDTSPVVAKMVADQQAHGAQVIVVGDSAQSIYGWRGAVDAMEMFSTKHHLQLSQSFRFGPAVATEANKWLRFLQSPMTLRGHDPIASVVTNDELDEPDAILCRTNAGTIRQVMLANEQRRRVAIVGGGDDARRLAEAAADLLAGKPTNHPELALFSNWREVQEFVEEGDAPDLRPFVQLIDEYTPPVIIRAINQTVQEPQAERIISTAHKSKGREWDAVQIDDDFPVPRINFETGEMETPSPEEVMLAYVAVTRAKKTLARGSLDWIDTYVPGAPSQVTSAAALRVADAPASTQDEWWDDEPQPAGSLSECDAVVLESLPAADAEWLRAEAGRRGIPVAAVLGRLVAAQRMYAQGTVGP